MVLTNLEVSFLFIMHYSSPSTIRVMRFGSNPIIVLSDKIILRVSSCIFSNRPIADILIKPEVGFIRMLWFFWEITNDVKILVQSNNISF